MRANEFRLDFFIAIAALLVSAASALALIYQTHIIQQQYSATIWPYINLETTSNPKSLALSISNDGLGPALIRSARLRIDGKPARGWGDVMTAMIHDLPRSVRRAGLGLSAMSLDQTTAIRSGESRRIFYVRILGDVPITAIERQTIALDLCYCSLNENCWRLDAVAGESPGSVPQPVAACKDRYHIDAAM